MEPSLFTTLQLGLLVTFIVTCIILLIIWISMKCNIRPIKAIVIIVSIPIVIVILHVIGSLVYKFIIK